MNYLVNSLRLTFYLDDEQETTNDAAAQEDLKQFEDHEDLIAGANLETSRKTYPPTLSGNQKNKNCICTLLLS